ncbi:MAG: hypothetical protein ABI629_24510 [bacterium]
MSVTAKQRLVVGVLVGLAFWPIAHRILVVQTRLSPWRFFGWAMYCTPKLPVVVEVTALRGKARTALALSELSNDERRAVHRLSEKRGMWGTYATPDRLAQRLLQSQHYADGIQIGVSHWYLDPDTARIATQRYEYVYRR